ncbi:AMP-binding protein [Pseudonocardia humida]|uniref:Long-chain-fatty-acid--CoA ligase n=1 Tax=Pseudonocardia humida TaxID=2800819 RepID=A0ABT1A6E3_9PSEU|nr:AMP-binding protein [Pseudonocardia humida]MCO1658587.1 AMP-binding protein [Pseudonocardia humida]
MAINDDVTGTLTGLLDGLVAADPDATAALDRVDDGFRPVSRAALREHAGAVRALLAAAGVGPGDCVGVWLPNWSDALAWQFAASGLGAHVIGLNTRYNVEEVAHVLRRAAPGVLAVAAGFHDLDLVARLRRAVAEVDGPPPLVVPVAGPGGAAPDPAAFDVGGGTALVDPAATPAAAPDRDGTDLAVAFTTSGSTGLPKLAAHRERAVVEHGAADAARLGIGPGDVVTVVVPLSGVFGFSTAVAALAGGAACLLEPVFDPPATLAAMAAHGATHVVGGDDMVSRLLDAWRAAPVALPRLRWVGLADFIGRVEEIAEWAAAEFGALASGVYGSSEVFALTLVWPADTPAPRRWTGGGTPASPAVRVRIGDPETGDPLPDGEQGELLVAGPTVVDAYLGSPEAGAAAFTADGWFRTGDLAVRHPDGGVEFVCRMGDVLRLSGFLVAPAEIELRLAAHDDVATAKVVGARSAEGTPQAVGFVVLRDGATATPDELRDWCAATLARFKVPARVEVVEAMPTTSGTNGTKIRAATLREWAEQGLPERRRLVDSRE